MSRETCLVTGASGFIGGRLTARLVDEGYEVRCLVRRSSDTTPLAALGVELALGDLTQAPTVAAAVRGARYVFHCGALVSDWATVKEIKAINVAGTRHVAEACAAGSVERLVHLSTTDVYGHPGERQIDETCAATRFRNWYAQTKLAAEADLRRVAREHQLHAVILRPATVFGPGSKDVIGDIAKAIRAGNMLLVDGGRHVAGLCYVENLVDAALLAMRSPAAPGEAFNLSDGLAVTWRQFVDDLAAGLGARPPRFSLPYPVASALAVSLEHGYRALRRATGLSTRPLLSRQAVQVLGIDQDFANRKARALLGWEPRVGYSEGLDATLAWLS